jgi:ADP-ribose pyrophosphatase
MHVVGVEIVSDQVIGREGGFLAIRRLRMKNRRADGSHSAEYLCDYLIRPMGQDAVVVAIFTRPATGGVRVLLRDGLRPPLHVGRADAGLPVPDGKGYLYFREVVAGIIENDDKGEEGIRRRAALEVMEEAGYQVAADQVRLLGAGSVPSPGAMAEKFWLAAVEVRDPDVTRIPTGDGSPMEEGAAIAWMELDEAIAACVRGEVEDMKTEIVLRRLKEHLGR